MNVKVVLAVGSLFFAIGILIFTYFFPQYDPVFTLPLFHFYIVTFFTFTAMVSAFLINITLAETTVPRHRLLALAYTTMAAIFFIHGICTPGAIILTFNPGIQWGAWLTFFAGGLFFTLATFDRPNKPMTAAAIRRINQTTAFSYILFALIVAFAPNWLAAINQWAGPIVASLIFWVSLILWGYAAFHLWRLWQETEAETDGLMALIAAWLFLAAISMHQFPTWHLSWWLYHILLLVGALTAVYALINQYEGLRRFRLRNYYLALGAIVTPFLSLLAAYVLSETVTNNLISSTENDAIIILVRRLGLLVTAGTMSALFGALYIIVRRADQLITHRSTELADAYQELQASESLRDELTSMIVHDLRNPLAATSLSLDLLKMTLDDPAKGAHRQKFHGQAKDSLDRMLNLINQILDTAKLEAGKLNLNRKTVSFADFLQKQIAPFALQAERQHNKIIQVIDPHLAEVSLDADLIGRVIDNLLSNALKYSPNDAVINVSAKLKDNELLIQIKDNGEGIPPQNLETIFDKFVQVTDESGQSLRKGTGLGLAFCKLVIEAHKGRIWAESELEKGSTFSFTIPQ